MKEASPPIREVPTFIGRLRSICPNAVVINVMPAAETSPDYESAADAADFVLLQPFTARHLQDVLRQAEDKLRLLQEVAAFRSIAASPDRRRGQRRQPPRNRGLFACLDPDGQGVRQGARRRLRPAPRAGPVPGRGGGDGAPESERAPARRPGGPPVPRRRLSRPRPARRGSPDAARGQRSPALAHRRGAAHADRRGPRPARRHRRPGDRARDGGAAGGRGDPPDLPRGAGRDSHARPANHRRRVQPRRDRDPVQSRHAPRHGDPRHPRASPAPVPEGIQRADPRPHVERRDHHRSRRERGDHEPPGGGDPRHVGRATRSARTCASCRRPWATCCSRR